MASSEKNDFCNGGIRTNKNKAPALVTLAPIVPASVSPPPRLPLPLSGLRLQPAPAVDEELRRGRKVLIVAQTRLPVFYNPVDNELRLQ